MPRQQTAWWRSLPRKVRTDVRRFFKSSESLVLRPTDIEKVITEHRERWQIPVRMSAKELIGELQSAVDLRTVRLEFPSRPETRHVLPKATPYDIALSLHEEGYFTHHTALCLNALTKLEPREIYVNLEQSNASNPDAEMQQSAINAAFKRRPRTTTRRAEVDDRSIVFVNGRQTGGEGVISRKEANGRRVRYTNLERTLIDAIARPAYSGGAVTILKAFKTASERLSIRKLVKMLNKMGFAYPYHQSIGFMLTRSASSQEAIAPFRAMPMRFDFYLENQIRKPKYDREWRLYYPAELDSVR